MITLVLGLWLSVRFSFKKGKINDNEKNSKCRRNDIDRLQKGNRRRLGSNK